MTGGVEWFGRYGRRIEWSIVVLFGALLVHAIADASGVLGAPGFRPRGHLVLTTGMFLGSIAPLLALRSLWLKLILAVVSVVLMLGSLRVAG